MLMLPIVRLVPELLLKAINDNINEILDNKAFRSNELNLLIEYYSLFMGRFRRVILNKIYKVRNP